MPRYYEAEIVDEGVPFEMVWDRLYVTDFEATGTREDETENLVNEALRLASVETAMLLVEMPDAVRVSLRSRDAVDVSAIAGRFGGGGHKRAAGLRVAGDIEQLKARLIAACTQALNAAGGDHG